MRNYLDIDALSRLVKSKRGALGLREASKKIGVSASTLSRVEVENGFIPDLPSFILLCNWLEVPSGGLMRSDMTARSIDEEIILKLRSSPQLDSATIAVLSSMVRSAYRITNEV